MSSYQYAYKYSAGKINQTFDNGNTLEVRLRVVKVISSLSNKFLALLTFGINLYQLTSSQGMNLVPGVPSALLQSPIVDFNYFSRISTTPYLDSYAIASLSKKIYVGGFVWNAVNSVWQHNRQGPAVAAATITDSTASLITGSIGLSATYLSYTKLIEINPNPFYEQQLVLRSRSNTSSVSMVLKGFYVYSTAIHPSQNKIYLYTTYGDLYACMFTTGPLVLSAPVLIAPGLFVKNADLEVIDASTMAIKTSDGMALFDIPSETLRATLFSKPGFFRNLYGTNFNLLVTHNRPARLYDMSIHAAAVPSQFINRPAREIIVNRDVTKKRFYVMTEDRVATYSYASGLVEITSKTKADILGMLSASSPTKIYAINDIDIGKYSPSTLSVLVAIQTGGVLRSVILLLDELTLTYIGEYLVAGNDVNYMTIFVFKSSTSLKDNIKVVGPDQFMTFILTPPASFGFVNFIIDVATLSPAVDPNYANVRLIKMTHFMKTSVNEYSSNTKSFMSLSFERVETSQRHTTATDSSFFYSLVTEPMNTPVTYIDSVSNDLWAPMISMTTHNFFVMYDILPIVIGEIESDELSFGAMYTTNKNNHTYITDGENSLMRIEPLNCPVGYSAPDMFIVGPCAVVNCLTCSLIRTSCITCTSPFVVAVGKQACLANCNPDYNLNGVCYAICPIEYYNMPAANNICVTDSVCSGTYGKVLLGDRCINTCPAGGSTNSSQYCLPPTGQAISKSSSAAYTSKCPAGELFWNHYQQCTNPSQLPTTGYTMTSTTIYCDGSTHFYDVDSKRCLQTCTLTVGTDISIGKFCASESTCRGLMNKFVDKSTTPTQCVDACAAGMWTDLISRNCVAACGNGLKSIVSNKSCDNKCPASMFELTANSSCLSESECYEAFSGSGLVSRDDRFCVSQCSKNQYKPRNKQECISTGSATGSFADVSNGMIGLLKTATPLILTGSSDYRVVTALCIMANTYTKLILTTNMNFTLEESDNSRVYYGTFREFADRFNDGLLGLLLGEKRRNLLSQYVCDAGFEKICLLGATDNFWFTKLLDFIFLAAMAILLVFLISILYVSKKTHWRKQVVKHLAEVFIYSFLMDNNVSFWYNLLLNLFVTDYSDPLFAVTKVFVILLLLAYVQFFVLYWFKHFLKNHKWFKFHMKLYHRLESLFDDLAAKGYETVVFAAFFAHDFVYAACLMTSKIASFYQQIIWLAVELYLIVLIVKYRSLFENRALFVRQLITECFFVIIMIEMIVIHFSDDTYSITPLLLITSLILLWLELIFTVCFVLYKLGVLCREYYAKSKAVAKIVPVKGRLQKGRSRTTGSQFPDMSLRRDDSESPNNRIKNIHAKNVFSLRSIEKPVKLDQLSKFDKKRTIIQEQDNMVSTERKNLT